MADARLWELEADELERAISEASGALSPAGIAWNLDPALAMAVDAVASLHHGPEPSREFASRLARQLGASTSRQRGWSVRPSRTQRLSFAGSAHHALPKLVFPIGRAVSYVSLAALLLLMLGGMWLTVDSQGTQRSTHRDEVSARVTDGLPDDSLGLSVVVKRITVAPGVTYNVIEHRLMFLIVESGSIDFRVFQDDPAVRLMPGEIGVTSVLDGAPATGVASIRNGDAAVPATLLTIGVYPNIDPKSPPSLPFRVAGVESTVVADDAVGVHMGDDATVTVRLLTLAAGEQVPAWTTAGLAWVLVERGPAELTLTGNYLPFPFAPGVERTEDSGAFLPLLPGVAVAARNAADAPVVLLVLTIDSAAATPPAD